MMANQRETEDAMVGALERHKRSESAHTGLFGISFVALIAGMFWLFIRLGLDGMYYVGGAVVCIVIAGVFADWTMKRAKAREPGRY
jgi:hypothetical protein